MYTVSVADTRNMPKDLSSFLDVHLLEVRLLVLSKLTERVVKLRLVDNLSTNNPLNSFQSAYIKHHSTETTLLSVHYHIIKASGVGTGGAEGAAAP